MHIYLRTILENEPHLYSVMEQQRLRECVSSAPGVETVKEIKRHVKGGYSVTIEADRNMIDQIVSHLSLSGYEGVF